MQTYYLNKHNYYRYDDLVEKYPSLSKGCRNKAAFIRKHELEDKHYLYARLAKNGQWHVSEGNSCRVDKFFLRKRHVDAHMIDEGEEAVMRPDVVNLDDGSLLEIETVGERTVDGCFFKLKDVARVFQIPNLANTITHSKHDSYVEGEHYQYFRLPNGRVEVYFTCRGFLRMLFTSRSEKAKRMQEKVTEYLYIMRFGTEREKEDNAGDMLEMMTNLTAEYAEPGSIGVSCVYLFVIGTVADLRESMQIDDSHRGSSWVCKWGRTTNLSQREANHMASYGTIPGATLSLQYYACIDENSTVQAEGDIKKMFSRKGLLFRYGSHQELAIIPRKKMKDVQKEYDSIGQIYPPVRHMSLTMDTHGHPSLDTFTAGYSYDSMDSRLSRSFREAAEFVGRHIGECIYLFSLGTVADLRDTMSIPDSYPDTSTVYKYGRTCDLEKRTRQHMKTYGNMDGVSLALVYHGYIDPERASEAEKAIAHSMTATGLSFSYDTHRELIIATDRQMKHVREQYDMVTELHRGRMKHIVDELEKQKKETELANHKKEVELARKETELERQKKETELAKKEIEILQLKLRLAELS